MASQNPPPRTAHHRTTGSCSAPARTTKRPRPSSARTKEIMQQQLEKQQKEPEIRQKQDSEKEEEIISSVPNKIKHKYLEEDEE